MELDLSIPEEPEELKREAIKNIEESEKKSEGRKRRINLEGLYSGIKKVPHSYLWEEWKEELKTKGIDWPKFLGLLSSSQGVIDSWLRGEASWEELVKSTKEVVEIYLRSGIK